MQEAFLSQGWSVETLDKDYGEDLLIRIFDDGEATPYSFYVQAKSAESLRHSKDGAYVRYPIDFDHIRHWNDFWDPVFLMLWDRQADALIWEMIQEPELPLDMSGKKAKVLVPRDHELTLDGLRAIRRKTLARHRRFQREKAGSEILVEALEGSLDAKIDYDPQSGVMVIDRANNGVEFRFFGELHQMISKLAGLHGISEEEIIRKAIRNFSDVAKEMESGVPRKVVKPDGTVLSFHTILEYGRYLDSLEFDLDDD
jgi:hypothetical protein